MKHTNINELGVVSLATHGPGQRPGDDFIGLVLAGLSDD